MAKRALLPLFLQSAEADFACVVANLFAGDWFQSAEADFACVAANLFAGNIHPEFVIFRGLITPLFLVRRGRRYSVQPRLKIAGDSSELAQDN